MLGHFLLLFPAAASAAATCYAINGSAVHDVLPCEPDSETSICCSQDDYCTSNNLCLNAHDNNAWSQQGCTDENWSQPCQKHCDADAGYPTIFDCEGGGDFSTMKACCGNLVDCCSKASNIFTIAVAKSIWKPPTASTSIPTSASTSSSSTRGRATLSTTPIAEGSATTTPEPTTGGGISNTLAIGLGVGIPIAACLIAAALFYFGRQLHQKNKLLQEAAAAYAEKHYDGGIHIMPPNQPAVAELSSVTRPQELGTYSR